MSILERQRAIDDLATVCADLLPYSSNPEWRGHISVQTICSEMRIEYWQPSSKVPGLRRLFDAQERSNAILFQKLIVRIVQEGLSYRRKKQSLMTPEELDALNDAVLRLGYKIPELWDPVFRKGLHEDLFGISEGRVEKIGKRLDLENHTEDTRTSKMLALKDTFEDLHRLTDRQEAGRRLEVILNELFEFSGLYPSEAFRVIGEQIDGAFELDGDTYLLEAKWERTPLAEKELLVFRGKIEGKSSMTRGMFISINGYSPQCKEAIRIGKQPTFFAIDGYDLMMILQQDIECGAFLRARRRLLAERGEMFASYAMTKERSEAI